MKIKTLIVEKEPIDIKEVARGKPEEVFKHRPLKLNKINPESKPLASTLSMKVALSYSDKKDTV